MLATQDHFLTRDFTPITRESHKGAGAKLAFVKHLAVGASMLAQFFQILECPIAPVALVTELWKNTISLAFVSYLHIRIGCVLAIRIHTF